MYFGEMSLVNCYIVMVLLFSLKPATPVLESQTLAELDKRIYDQLRSNAGSYPEGENLKNSHENEVDRIIKGHSKLDILENMQNKVRRSKQKLVAELVNDLESKYDHHKSSHGLTDETRNDSEITKQHEPLNEDKLSTVEKDLLQRVLNKTFTLERYFVKQIKELETQNKDERLVRTELKNILGNLRRFQNGDSTKVTHDPDSTKVNALISSNSTGGNDADSRTQYINDQVIHPTQEIDDEASDVQKQRAGSLHDLETRLLHDLVLAHENGLSVKKLLMKQEIEDDPEQELENLNAEMHERKHPQYGQHEV